MPQGKLKIDIRRSKILELLKKDGKVRVGDLTRLLGTTAVTIRTDLDALVAEGHAERVTGGAVYLGKGDAGFYTGADIPYLKEKREIAEIISGMINDGDTVFINSGTTTEVIAAALAGHTALSIVTNSLAVATVLRECPSFRIIMLGGELNARYGFTYGADVLEKLSGYHADWAILSVDGISAGSGITTYHAEEAGTNRMMMAGARRVIIAADSTKIGRAGFMKICDSAPGIDLVTDSAPMSDELMALIASEVNVIRK